jgi:SAM-dependent methyltransferase
VADPRATIYGDLHQGALQTLEGANAASARAILQLLFSRFRPESILDVGCGLGTWLEAATQLGVADIQGIEGAWLDPKLARIPAERIRTLDLEKPFDLGRRFGLAVSIEVAEHLSPAAAGAFVRSLTQHSDVVLFSGAIPFQGGDHHVNEQFPDYWGRFFADHGYVPVDCIRPAIWRSTSILVWLRQNLVVFAKEALTCGAGPFAGAMPGPLSIVHPEVYRSLAEQANEQLAEYNRMLGWLAEGKRLSATRNADGSLAITVADGPVPR